MSDQPDLGALLQQAAQLQEQLVAAQQQAAEMVVEGQAGGLVRVEVTGAGVVQAVHIDPKAVDPAEVDLLEDLVLAALHDAMAKASELSQQAMGSLDLGGLSGLLGGGGPQ